MELSTISITEVVSFGSALAIAISWSINKSILWAVFHGALSWGYVIYYAWTRKKGDNNV